MQHKITFASTLLMAMVWPLTAQASSQLALDKGCYSCHGANQRGEAPSFERLASKLAKYKGDQAGEQNFVSEFQAGEMLNHIPVHERLSPASAKTLVHWLMEGAK
ncbi:MAG: c-type cytochrome [Rhodoferax sp.]|uniref:c-type cytochrome n=1 Tax=Rhodoferax sp. TaxID=50421 RepID=UPI0030175CDF